MAKYIDWAPVLPDLGPGRAIPRHPERRGGGERGARVFADGQAMLKRLIDGRWLTANAVVGLYPANSVNDDDIAFYTDESRTKVA